MKQHYILTLLLLPLLCIAQNDTIYLDGSIGKIGKSLGTSLAITMEMQTGGIAKYMLSNTLTNNNQLSNGSGYVTPSSASAFTNKTGNISMWTNNAGYLTSVPAQSFASLTSKPTTLSGYGITDAYPLTGNPSGFITSMPTKTFNNAPARSIVSTAAAANGWQVSLTKDANVSYSASINTSVSLSGNSSGYIVLEICPTNSSTAVNWIEINRISSGQSGTLVVGLVLNQVGGAPLTGLVPAGYYARIRSVNVSGTPTYTTNGQQEVY